MADAALGWFARHPGFQAARAVLVELLRTAVGPAGPGVRVPEALLEMRNMLATRMEKWFKDQERLTEQRGEARGEQIGRQQGEAALLLRLLQRRFGVLPDWVSDRVLTADTMTIEDWGLRVLDAATLDEVFA